MEKDDHIDAVYLAEELQVAKKYIKDLEARLEKRENELRNAQQRAKKSFRRKDRRNGILNQADLPTQRVISDVSQFNEPSDSVELTDYILLIILGFEQPNPEVSHSLPLYVRTLQGKSYVVGPNGVSIGSGENCGIKFSNEVGLLDHHAEIKMKRNQGSELLVHTLELNVNSTSRNETDVDFTKVLYTGSTFKTGWVVWKVTPVPKRNLVQSKLFAAIRNKDCQFFLQSLKDLDEWNSSIENTKDFIHLNMEENKQFRVAHNKASCTSNNTMSQYITEITSNDQYSLLHVAVDYNCVDIVYQLLQRKVDVNLKCGNRQLTPLHLACKQSSIKLVGLLLKNGADIEIKDSNKKDSINMTESYPIKKKLMLSHQLCLASYGGDHKEIESIFSNNNDICVDVIGFKGYTALQLASMNGHFLCARVLLKKKVKVNLSCYKDKCTPLHYACIGNHTNIISLLLAYGALQTTVDGLGYTPLQLVRSRDAYELFDKSEMSLCLATQIGDIEEVRAILLRHTVEEDFKIAPDLLRHKMSTGKYGRKTSRQMIFQNLGLCALIDQQNEKGLSPIHLAAAAGDIEIIKVLLSYGAKIDFPGGLERQTALFFACLSGRTKCVKFLLMMGADQEFCDARGMQCLDYVEDRIKQLKDSLEENASDVSMNRNIDITESLIPPQYISRLNGCNSFLKAPSEMRHQLQRFFCVLNVLRSGQQNLYEALKAKDYHTLEGLLREDEVNVNGPLTRVLPITALNYASSLGLDRATELLLSHEANPFIQDAQSYTPIHTAAESGFGNIVRILVHHGVDVNLQTNIQKSTSLHLAAKRNHRIVVEVLLTEGADTSIRDIDGNTPFDLTSDISIQTLLAQGNERLYVALKLDDIKLVQSLLNEIDVNVNFRDHVTPLHVVCEHGSLSLCRLLIDSGAHINVLGGVNYGTPLHYAAGASSPDIIRLLIKRGADLTLEDSNGKTAFEVASNNITRQAIIQGKKEMQHQQDISMNVERDDVCRICFSNPVDTMVLPCAHTAFCSACVAQIQACALDRQTIVNVVFLPQKPEKN